MTSKMQHFSMAELAAIRADLAAAPEHVHLDNAGASLMPAQVRAVMHEHLTREGAVGGYVAQEQAAEGIERAYGAVAGLIGAAPDEIAFAGSATDAWDRLFYSLPLEPGAHIVTAYSEYCGNYIAMHDRARKCSADIIVIGRDHHGGLDLVALDRALGDPRAKLLALSHVASSSGDILDAAGAGRIARAHGVPFLLDACQSIGQLPVDVGEIGCDMLTGTARKFLRGPRGVGFLYVARTMLPRLEPVMLTNMSAEWRSRDGFAMREDARLFEAWERNIAGILGLGAAVDYARKLGMPRISSRALALAAQLREALGGLSDVECLDPGSRLSAIVTFRHRRIDPVRMKTLAAARNTAIQVASVVHTRLDLEARGIESAVRVSPHYFTLEDEIGRFVDFVAAL